MATPFTDVYSRAIFKFADYKFLQQEIDVRQGVLERYLISAATEFRRISKVDLSYDAEEKQFNGDLTDEEIEILAIGTAFYWVSYKTLDSELLKNRMNSKEYSYFSPGNLLKEVKDLRNTLRAEFNSRMKQYSYFDNTLDTLKN